MRMLPGKLWMLQGAPVSMKPGASRSFSRCRWMLFASLTKSNPYPLQENQNMYTAQKDAHGNVIVCKGSDTRRGYRIVFTGSYADCLRFKVEA